MIKLFVSYYHNLLCKLKEFKMSTLRMEKKISDILNCQLENVCPIFIDKTNNNLPMSQKHKKRNVDDQISEKEIVNSMLHKELIRYNSNEVQRIFFKYMVTFCNVYNITYM